MAMILSSYTFYIADRKIPVSKEDIPTQEDIDLWPHLNGVFIPRVDAEIGLLIASDIPEALNPVEIRHSEHAGPYTSRTRIGWAVNGPLRRSPGGTRIVSSFIKADPQLQQMVQDFYNRDFVDLFFNDTTEMSQDECRFMRNTEKIKFKDGHNEIPLLFKSGFTSIPDSSFLHFLWWDDDNMATEAWEYQMLVHLLSLWSRIISGVRKFCPS